MGWWTLADGQKQQPFRIKLHYPNVGVGSSASSGTRFLVPKNFS
jgi:hypothetical protein